MAHDHNPFRAHRSGARRTTARTAERTTSRPIREAQARQAARRLRAAGATAAEVREAFADASDDDVAQFVNARLGRRELTKIIERWRRSSDDEGDPADTGDAETPREPDAGPAETPGRPEGGAGTSGADPGPQNDTGPDLSLVAGSIPEVLERVGEDPGLARQAVLAELARARQAGDEPRRTLLDKLNALG